MAKRMPDPPALLVRYLAGYAPADHVDQVTKLRIVSSVLQEAARLAANIDPDDKPLAEPLRHYLLSDIEGLPLYHTAEEVAEALGVTRRWIWRLCRQGRIAYTRIGTRTIRFSPEDFATLREMVQRHAFADIEEA